VKVLFATEIAGKIELQDLFSELAVWLYLSTCARGQLMKREKFELGHPPLFCSFSMRAFWMGDLL
jgi:hypothetical protein